MSRLRKEGNRVLNNAERCKQWRKNNPDKIKAWNQRLNKKWNEINHKKWNPRRMKFTPLGKQILLKENPRKGICQKCGKKGLTDIHHTKYHEDDPLRQTIELCRSCHMKESYRLGQLTGLVKGWNRKK